MFFLEFYNVFKVLMKNINSDSGISDFREFKNSYYDLGEFLNSLYFVFLFVSSYMLNSIMRELWDRSLLSFLVNFIMVIVGYGLLLRKLRSKI